MNTKLISLFISISLLSACTGVSTKPDVKTPAPPATAQTPDAKPGAGGYYLDDGPSADAPADIDGIPDAQLKVETPLENSNKPYSALGQQYTPMTSYKPYKKQGVASWYGKRYHGKKTSSGEVYDMFAMTAAHPILPIPSYARITNPANGRSVVVRINDRGPFKHDRLVDLSYAAAYKLRLVDQGSALVDLEMIDTSSREAILKATQKPVVITENTSNGAPAQVANPSATSMPAITSPVEVESTVTETPVANAPIAPPSPEPVVLAEPAQVDIPPAKPNKSAVTSGASKGQYYVQAGAFKSEANSQALQKKIQNLAIAKNKNTDSTYNDGIYRVMLGPFASRKEADSAATSIRKQLGISTIIKN